jgi:hypothetical protein
MSNLETSKVVAPKVKFLEKKLDLSFLQMGDVITGVSKGKISMPQLIEALLKKVGPAELLFSTWAISQKPIEQLQRWKSQGLLSSLTVVLDHRLKERKPAQFAYLSGIADVVHSAKCHAKVAVLLNDAWRVVVIGSANWTVNPRFEAFVIMADADAATYHTEWLRNPTI